MTSDGQPKDHPKRNYSINGERREISHDEVISRSDTLKLDFLLGKFLVKRGNFDTILFLSDERLRRLDDIDLTLRYRQ